MTSRQSHRVVFLSGADGLLAHGLVSALSRPGVAFAFHAGYRSGLDSLIAHARANGAEAMSVAEVETDPEAPLLGPAARRCLAELGRIDVALHADVPDVDAFPRSVRERLPCNWWTEVWQELGSIAELVVGVAPVMGEHGGGRMILLVPEGAPARSPFLLAAAAAAETLVVAVRAQLEMLGVRAFAVPVPAVTIPTTWQPFAPTPAGLNAIVTRVAAEATG